MVTTSKKGLQPERLPPTENAIKFHSFRMFLQIRHWLDVDCGDGRNETLWIDKTLRGWKKEKDVLVPIKTDKVSVHKRFKINL